MPRRSITAHEKRVVGARQAWRCNACDTMLLATFEVDHVVPLHLGGDDDVSNCQALCCECHRKKTLRENVARAHALRHARATRSNRPALICARCGWIVSPYFVHRC